VMNEPRIVDLAGQGDGAGHVEHHGAVTPEHRVAQAPGPVRKSLGSSRGPRRPRSRRASTRRSPACRSRAHRGKGPSRLP
jgi:hypothetical protein